MKEGNNIIYDFLHFIDCIAAWIVFEEIHCISDVNGGIAHWTSIIEVLGGAFNYFF